MVNGCSHGTLLHVSPPGSHWSICYYHQDLLRRQLRAGSRPTPSPLTAVPLLLAGASGTEDRNSPFASGGPVWATRSSAIHFQGWLLRQVSCYTLLGGFQLPWPPSCCLKQPTPFVGSDERPCCGALTGRSVHPTSPVLLTKTGPLGTPHRRPGFNDCSSKPATAPVVSLRIG
jgi:hypothetical protein